MNARERTALAILVLCLLLQMQRGSAAIVPASKATAAVYVYEKSDTAIPNAVKAAIDKLNRQGIVANVFDVDTISGTGQTPKQYAAALPAAREAGLPALVIMGGGDRILRVVKNPQTEEAVTEAVK